MTGPLRKILKLLAPSTFALILAATVSRAEVQHSNDSEAPPPPPGMVLIPSGDFMMGSYDGHADEQPLHPVFVDAFYIDKYEVTNSDYKKFCDTTHHKPPYNWVNGHIPKDTDHPVVLVSWDDAMAYSVWAGKRLPTEAEWEKAARGSVVGAKYPWGDEIKPVNARYASRLGSVSVGKYAANKFGVFDVAGNVWEWVADWYDGEYYSYSRQRNPQGPPTGHYHVVRGGSWYDQPNYLRCAYRNWGKPDQLSLTVGFRCAKSLPGEAPPPPPDVNNLPITQLKVGDRAPDFTLPDQNEMPVKFSELWPKKNIVLIFIGPGFTGGAKAEVGSYEGDYVFFPQADADLVAITEEEPSAVAALKNESKAAFPILADRHADVAKLYGVYLDRWEMARRSTFVVDTHGTIRYVRQSPFDVDNEHALDFCFKAFVHGEMPVAAKAP